MSMHAAEWMLLGAGAVLTLGLVIFFLVVFTRGGSEKR